MEDPLRFSSLHVRLSVLHSNIFSCNYNLPPICSAGRWVKFEVVGLVLPVSMTRIVSIT